MQNQNESLDKKEKLRRQVWVGYAAFFFFWSICAYALVLSWIPTNELFARRIGGRPYISDFVNVYDAGILGRQARSTNIYDPKIQAALAEKVVAPVVPEIPFYLQAPPNFFAATIPLSLFSPVGAWFVYCGVGLALNMWALGALAWKYFPTRFARTMVLLASIGSFPMWVGIEEGNSSIYLLPPLVLFWWLLQRKKFFAAGLATGLLMVKVQYLPFIGVIGLFIGGARYLGGAVVAGLAVLGFTVAVVGLDNVLEWPRVLMHAETTTAYSGVATDKMQNVLGMIVAATGHQNTPVGRSIANALFVAAVLFIGYFWRKPYQWLSERSEYAFEICAAISTAVMLIFSIHTHSHDYILMLPTCLWLYVAAQRDGKPGVAKAAAAFPGLTWPLFLLAQLPFLPIQPIATFAMIFTGCAALAWWKKA
jgi:hypothetical protein